MHEKSFESTAMIESFLRRSSKANRWIRLISNAPDNAPKASENESWLRKLGQQQNRRDPHSRPQNALIDEAVSDAKTLSSEYDVVSTPPDSLYIHIKSPLSQFTTISHLQPKHQRHAQAKEFVDVRILKCRSGSGGNGAVSFFRDAGRSIGPPDGGDGGDGGGVYVQAVEGLNSLAKLKTSYIGADGEAGAAKQLDGARGKDVLISVPIGTVVKWCMNPALVRSAIGTSKESVQLPLRKVLERQKVSLQCTGRFEMDQKPTHIQLFRDSYSPGEGWHFKAKDKEYHDSKDWFEALKEKVKVYDFETTQSELKADRFALRGLDLDKPSEKPICLLKGGKGGLGNMHFLTNIIRNPRFAKIGRSGLEQYFMFELKSLADLGLVGLPNAGKSTILSRISNARPKVGHWEFTTTHPSIGTVSLGIDGLSFTVADIPGIIKGAAQDKGMGLEFLRHIQRSKGWTIVVSLEKQDPLADLNTLLNELGGVEEVTKKNVLVVCNKADIDPSDPASQNKFYKIEDFCKAYNWDVLPISALNGDNIDLLVRKMAICAGKL
ncbi:LANO_0E00628g1_1 [Lachancea nothofagi CBS 11611]|uniref:LANO_0E00628g1_1 n=1 Tax=Lachancea nothofagi CBS 11611 TaxID=1266666 RepID=A0A1G4JP27_9SACH|nr:LANO_0E00628g1_1 [Lachancea nothofagi CBS 11611]